MKNYIKATSDIVIKYLLGVQEAEESLVGFINAVLEDSNLPLIERAEVQNPFNRKNFYSDKESILDIKAVDKNGRTYNIEIQSTGDRVFKNRSLYYWSKLYSSQITEGNDYKILNPVICINLLDFTLFESESVHSCFMVQEKDRHDILSDQLELHFIELPKLNNKVSYSHLTNWLIYLKYEGKEENNAKREVAKVTDNNPDIKKAHDRYVEFVSDKELREQYEARMKAQMDQRYHIGIAREEGLKQGQEIGLAQGLEQGMEQGIEIGKKEVKLEDARKMKEKGIDIELIAEISGLPKEEILRL